MSVDRVGRPDPAGADLWEDERHAWAQYHARLNASDEARDRWRAVVHEIERVRRENGWPSTPDEVNEPPMTDAEWGPFARATGIEPSTADELDEAE